MLDKAWVANDATTHPVAAGEARDALPDQPRVQPLQIGRITKHHIAGPFALVHRPIIVEVERAKVPLVNHLMHPRFSFMHVRPQTWAPYTIRLCINGREWLARQMTAVGIGYERLDNCFPWIADVPAAQGCT